jgi:hypothetical protein
MAYAPYTLSSQFNFGTRQNLPRYLRLPTPRIRVYMLFQVYNDAILRLFTSTDSGMFRDEIGSREDLPTINEIPFASVLGSTP